MHVRLCATRPCVPPPRGRSRSAQRHEDPPQHGQQSPPPSGRPLPLQRFTLRLQRQHRILRRKLWIF